MPAFFLVGDADWLARIDPAAPVRRIERPDDAVRIFPDALPVLPLPLTAPVEPGTADPEHAPAVIASIERAVAAAGSGAASAVVTLPIQKESLTSAGFAHPGHTEFLAELTGARRSVMMLVGEGLRAVPLTVHIPLSEVSGRLTGALIEETARIVADALRADCWFHNHGTIDSDKGRAIKSEIRRCFYPDAADWKAMVWTCASDIERRMIAGLASLD